MQCFWATDAASRDLSGLERLDHDHGERHSQAASEHREIVSAAGGISKGIERVRLGGPKGETRELLNDVEDDPHRPKRDAALTTRLANAYGSLAWYHLFNRQFAEAEQAAAAGLAIDPEQEWIHTNLALGLLFQGKWEEAKEVYVSFKGKAYNAQNTWVEIFRQDLEALEAAGITHPDVGKARKLLEGE
jgi:tetratricopeptide (TPR) repeat protein